LLKLENLESGYSVGTPDVFKSSSCISLERSLVGMRDVPRIYVGRNFGSHLHSIIIPSLLFDTICYDFGGVLISGLDLLATTAGERRNFRAFAENVVMGTGQPQNPKNDKSNTKERKARSVKQPAVGRQNPVLRMKMMYIVDNADGC